MEKMKLLIVEDDEALRGQMSWSLSGDYDILLASDADEAMEAMASKSPGLVALDLGLPPFPSGPEEGLRLLSRILGHDPSARVVVITASTDREVALSAISLGAHDYFTKPFDDVELKSVLRRASYIWALEAGYGRASSRCEHQTFEDIVGTSQAMQEVFGAIRKVAASEVPTLITGESGTGKELVARAIHANSFRRSGPFVPINCGAIPENLLESELFGHEKGAFTGAHRLRSGRIEVAAGGTLFLDEIADLSPALQVKMLRFLQNHKIERVGGRETLDMDVRVLAATNRPVKRLIDEGRFREDLYYRLAVVAIELPPLRERGDDSLLLVRSFLRRFGSGSSPKFLGIESIEAIKAYDWPGNVRELENRIKRALAFSDGPVIKPADMGFGAQEADIRLDLRKAREDLEMRYANLAMVKHKGNISRAAGELGLSRPTLHQIIKKYRIGR